MPGLFGRSSTISNLWLPTDIGGCILWLRSDLGITHDGNPTYRVSLEADQANSWNVSQSTDSKKPVWYDAQINGHPAILNDAIDDIMANASFNSLNGLGASTIYLVFKALITDSNDYELFHTSIGGNIQFYLDTMNTYFSPGNRGFFTFSDHTSYHVYKSVFDGSLEGDANRLKIWLDNVPQTLSFSGGIGTNYGTGDGIYIGSHPDYDMQFNGYRAELIEFNKALSAGEQTLMDNYLSPRYGTY